MKQKNNDTPSLITKDEKYINDPVTIVNTFNNFFTSVAEIVHTKIKFSNKSFRNFLSSEINDSFIITSTNKEEIYKIISTLNSNKSCGPKSIPTKILHLLQDEISKHLTTTCHLSFSTGVLPAVLTTKVIPIHKKNSKPEVSNYRPISLLSNIDKSFEKLMHNRLIEFFEKKQILYYRQFGFRKDFSTNHAILTLLKSIQKALDDRQFACGIFIDLEKAFDTVSHDIPLENLNHYGIRSTANDWFRSYLSYRTKFVSINGFNSDYKTVKYVIPQGSVLGPLLFLIFINDLNIAIKISETFHFADDTCLLNIKYSIKKINKVVNKDLTFLIQWLHANKIFLNVAKTEVIIFRRKKKQLDFGLNLKICGKKLKASNYVKYLGIYLDEYLEWSHHGNYLSHKLVKASAILCKLCHYVNEATIKSIYYAIFHSNLPYVCTAWGQNLNPKHCINLLEKKAM